MASIEVFFLDGSKMSLDDVDESNSGSQNVLQVRSNGKIYSFPVTSVKYCVATP